MKNLFDYIKMYGSFTFKDKEFNEIDNLILARISYLPLEQMLCNDKFTIQEVNDIIGNLDNKEFIMDDDKKLLNIISETNRYKNLKLVNFKSDFSKEQEKQFAAVTIKLPKNYIYVSFRGTDDSLIGWKEDFNMSFLDSIPAQKESVKYLNNTKINLFSKLIVGGHSKGGNLAIYSSMYANSNIKNKIKLIANIDGPGFFKELIESKEYLTIKDRVKTYIPQTSIVGRMLNSDNNYITVKSRAKLMMQHDVYSWIVDDFKLIYLDDIDKESKRIDKVVKEWLKNLSFEKRERMINLIFGMLDNADFETLSQLEKDWYKKIKFFYSSYKDLNKEDKEMLDEINKHLLKSIKNVILKKVEY